MFEQESEALLILGLSSCRPPCGEALKRIFTQDRKMCYRLLQTPVYNKNIQAAIYLFALHFLLKNHSCPSNTGSMDTIFTAVSVWSRPSSTKQVSMSEEHEWGRKEACVKSAGATGCRNRRGKDFFPSTASIKS